MAYLECPVCGNEYYVKPFVLKKGKGKYCSIKCYCKFTGRQLPKSYPHNKKCKECNQDFEIISYRYRKREYCSRSCAAKNSNRKRKGIKYNVPLKENAESSFRKRLIKLYGHICMIPCCNYTNFVEAHHIVSRSNKGQHYVSNGILLCPNHHKEADNGLISEKDLLLFKKEWKVPAKGC